MNDRLLQETQPEQEDIGTGLDVVPDIPSVPAAPKQGGFGSALNADKTGFIEVPAAPAKTDITIGRRGLELSSLSELNRFARAVSESSFAPPAYKGKPQDIMIAIQMGSELGFAPMTSLQNIAVIQGRPTIWGDMAKALVMNSGVCQEFKEWTEGSIQDKSMTAYCEVTRKGMEPYTSTFSIDQAIRAKLWNKAGTWQQYPERMLQMRARGFAIRDVFPDAMKGLCIHEEAEDYPQPTQAQPATSLDDVADRMNNTDGKDGE